MKRLNEAPPAEEVRPAVSEAGERIDAPSEDQQFFDESLRASTRSLGRLIKERRKSTQ
jgi:hypothetical protein